MKDKDVKTIELTNGAKVAAIIVPKKDKTEEIRVRKYLENAKLLKRNIEILIALKNRVPAKALDPNCEPVTDTGICSTAVNDIDLKDFYVLDNKRHRVSIEINGEKYTILKDNDDLCEFLVKFLSNQVSNIF